MDLSRYKDHIDVVWDVMSKYSVVGSDLPLDEVCTSGNCLEAEAQEKPIDFDIDKLKSKVDFAKKNCDDIKEMCSSITKELRDLYDSSDQTYDRLQKPPPENYLVLHNSCHQKLKEIVDFSASAYSDFRCICMSFKESEKFDSSYLNTLGSEVASRQRRLNAHSKLTDQILKLYSLQV